MGKGRKVPPLTVDDFRRVLKLLGYVQVDGTKHLPYEHAGHGRKVNIDEKWGHVKIGSWVFKSVVYEQMGISKDEFLAVYWKTRGR